MSIVAAERVQFATADHYATRLPRAQISLALLGLGNVGTAVAAMAGRDGTSAVRLAGALVRDTRRPRSLPHGADVPLTTSLDDLIRARPDVIVEALGGLEPARALVLESLQRGIPVVTANKSLLAAHGDELFGAAADAGVPLRYEASVIAGVPFLGAFGRRPRASAVTAIAGVVNGTSNFILSRMTSDRETCAGALQEAQRRGLAEPDPARDLRGVDAAEKLCVLLRHFGRWSVHPCDLERIGIETLNAEDLRAAAAAGGAIKPVVFAEWDDTALQAFAGPAFLPSGHPLAAVEGVTNGILLRGGPAGDLFYRGAGAGPAVTAATILDDVTEAVEDTRRQPDRGERAVWKPAVPAAPTTAWFVRISAPRLPPPSDAADLLGAHDVWLARTSDTLDRDGRQSRWCWTYPVQGRRIARALDALAAAWPCEVARIRALET